MSKFEKQVINQQLKNSTELMNLAIPDKYSHIDFTPPKGAQEAAKRALDNRAKKPSSQRGMTPIGIARARDLINAKQLSPDTVRRMLAYFTRHEVDKQAEGFNAGENGFPSAGRVAWDLWGGDAGFRWATSKRNEIQGDEGKSLDCCTPGVVYKSHPFYGYELMEAHTNE